MTNGYKLAAKVEEKIMETLHLRAEHQTIELLMSVINKMSQEGQEVEILDNTAYQQEQQMIFKALIEEKNEQVFEHKELWNDLLK